MHQGRKRETLMTSSQTGAAVAVAISLFASLSYGQDQASSAPLVTTDEEPGRR
jgi:hypothetical protein